MCGIVGYIGGREAREVLVDGLKRLEYRGYDVAGLVLGSDKDYLIIKEAGEVEDLERMLQEVPAGSSQGIGYIRWGTRGGVSRANADSHKDAGGHFALVFKGIIENFSELRDELEREGAGFLPETDTEAIVHLVAMSFSRTGDMLETLVYLQKRLKGSFTLALMLHGHPDSIFVTRRGSPLALRSGDGEVLFASDIHAFPPYTGWIQYLEDSDIAELSSSGVRIWDERGHPVERAAVFVDWDVPLTEKSGFSHYMLKEIHEQGMVLRRSLKGRVVDGKTVISGELGWDEEMVSKWKKVHIVACGSSYYSALVAERLLEKWTDLEIKVDIASEYRYRHLSCDPSTLAVFVSQSGETADTLAALRKAKAGGAHCLAITNVRDSTMAREVHSLLLLKAGPEIGVAATKSFTGQLAALFLVALQLGSMRGILASHEEERLVNELTRVPYKVELLLEKEGEVREIARKYARSENMLFIGRGMSFPVAQEGALKLKEVSYIHAEALAAGEMKHGPIALLEPGVPVLAVIPRDSLYEKTLLNIQDIRARNVSLVAVCTDGDSLVPEQADSVIEVPWTEEEFTPFLTVIPLQFLSFHIGSILGREIDQPRNLAKSVTVE